MKLTIALFVIAVFATCAATAADESERSDIPPEHHHTLMEAAPLPGDSLYQLHVSLEDADGSKRLLSELRGQPLLVTMFYSHCTTVCPLITAELQNIDHRLTPQQRAGIRVLMISFDTKRDTPTELRNFERQHQIHDPRWIVARASANDVRLVAAVLSIRYRQLPDHSFNHSAVISLADRDSVVRASALGEQAADASFMATVQSLSAAGSANRPPDE